MSKSNRYPNNKNLQKASECLKFIKILTEFIDSDLTENQLIEIRSHLSNCLLCTKTYKEFRFLLHLCQTQLVEEPKTVSLQLWEVLEKRFQRKTYRHFK